MTTKGLHAFLDAARPDAAPASDADAALRELDGATETPAAFARARGYDLAASDGTLPDEALGDVAGNTAAAGPVPAMIKWSC